MAPQESGRVEPTDFASRASSADASVLESLADMLSAAASAGLAEARVASSVADVQARYVELVGRLVEAGGAGPRSGLDRSALEVLQELGTHVRETLSALAAKDQARSAVIDSASGKEDEVKRGGEAGPLRFMQAVPEVLVNFKFGKGTTADAKERDKLVKKFMDSLDKHLVKDPEKPRFGKKFKAAPKTQDVDVPEKLKGGEFTEKDALGSGKPGTYKYDPAAIDVITKHGNSQKQRKLTVIVVKELEGPPVATAFSSTMTTKNGADLGQKEGIIIEEGKLADAKDDLTPAHEVVHLGGLPDAPNKLYPGWGKLNSYDPKRTDDLLEADEKQVKDYFDKKVEAVVE
jgi:hypothetical protein